jgi:hypothetical protein
VSEDAAATLRRFIDVARYRPGLHPDGDVEALAPGALAALERLTKERDALEVERNDFASDRVVWKERWGHSRAEVERLTKRVEELDANKLARAALAEDTDG